MPSFTIGNSRESDPQPSVSPSRHVLPVLFLLAALVAPGGAAAQGPQAADRQTLRGTLDLVIEDHVGRGPTMAYFLREDDTDRMVELAFDRVPPGQLRTGQRATVTGRSEGNRKLWVDTLSTDGSTGVPGTPQADATLTERRAVVLMVDFADAKASLRYTLPQLVSGLYTGTRSVDALYRTASFGQLGFAPDADGNGAPDVFGPFAISLSAAANCNYYDWAYAAEAAAQAAGIDFSRYQHRVFVLPHYSSLPACTWAGVANVGCGTFCRAWIAEAESPMVTAHELGHNLNMAHAGTDPENDGTINAAYGDSSDPMGSSRAWHVFNGAHADQLGWFGAFPGSVVTVTSSGTFDVMAVGTNPASATGPHVLKVRKTDSNDYYYLTYREAVGYDDTLSSTYTRGLNIHRYAGSGYAATSFITSLADLASFTDTANGITITQLAHGSGFARVSIEFPGGGSTCAPASARVALNPASQIAKSGGVLAYTVSVTNNDGAGCGQTTFALGYSGVPQGSLSAASLLLASGQTATTSLQVNTSAADGTYTLSVQATDADGVAPLHSTVTNGTASVTIDGTAPTVPAGLTATYVSRRNRVDLSWTGSTDSVSGLSGYLVYRNGTAVAETAGVTWTDTAVASGNTYTYKVAAKDKAGNTSASSTEARVTASGSSGGGKKK